MEFIKREEGCELRMYHDAAGLPTIGVGHLITDEDEDIGMTITMAQAMELLRRDLEDHESDVLRAVKVPLKQHQFDALVSFDFNVGGHNFRRSTLLKKLNAGDFDGAAGQFSRWVYAGAEVVPGLIARRVREAKLFSMGDYGI